MVLMKTLLIDVRMAEANDAVAVAETHRRSWISAYSGLIPHKPLTQMLERRGDKWWLRAIKGQTTILVVELNGVVAGYATIGISRARGLPQEGEIYELYLRPEYQGVGLGRVLFKECRRLLKSLGCRGMIAWCLEDSDNAVRFFRSHGGEDIAEGMEDFGETLLKKIGFAWE
jgi:ribosomal protein S18 acetylase RimI-like enzyme